MTDFTPPELTHLEARALGIAIQIALCQITGVDYDTEASLAVFRENQQDLLKALTSAHHKVAQSLGVQPEHTIGMQYDGSGDIRTVLTRLDGGPGHNKQTTGEAESNGNPRW